VFICNAQLFCVGVDRPQGVGDGEEEEAVIEIERQVSLV
jgi:hypothetical protein